MSAKWIGLVSGVILVVGGSLFFLMPRSSRGNLENVPAITLVPEPAPLDAEISNRLIERFIAEDEGIQTALKGGPPPSATAEVSAATRTAKSDKDLLFELMSPWVYVKYRKINQIEEAQFYNTHNRKSTPYLPVGGTLVGATIVKMDSDRATVKLADATQDLFYVPLQAPPFDPTVPRTPEQVKAAQRRYYETVYKPSVVMGWKYNELAGRPREIPVPPRAEQYEQALNYLDLMEQRIQDAAPVDVPKEVMVDTNQLSEDQKELYDTYMQAIKRTPEEIKTAIEEWREKIRQRQASEEQGEPLESEQTGQGK